MSNEKVRGTNVNTYPIINREADDEDLRSDLASVVEEDYVVAGGGDGIIDRQMRRWHWRYGEFGYDGLLDRRLGKPSPKRLPLALVEQVFAWPLFSRLRVTTFEENSSSQRTIRRLIIHRPQRSRQSNSRSDL